ncbi:MAG: hypothetical protein WBD28_02175 [Candidatus Zixiibacteriota bacterium]
MDSIKENIEKSVREFNKFRAPEAEAKFLLLNKEYFKIEFTGPFCHACGYHDYFDDFKIFLEELNSKTDISQIEETKNGATVTFKITN